MTMESIKMQNGALGTIPPSLLLTNRELLWLTYGEGGSENMLTLTHTHTHTCPSSLRGLLSVIKD